MRTLLARKVAEGLSARSVQIVHGTLHTMLGEAVRDEVITRNPAAVVRSPALTREEVKPWSPQEASAFLSASVDHRLYAVFAVGVALGLRRGELLALRWSDVDLDEGLVHVRQNVQRLLEVGLGRRQPQDQSVSSDGSAAGAIDRGSPCASSPSGGGGVGSRSTVA